MLRIGEDFDRYRVEALIGQGGMGHVYRAFDSRLQRRVALKVLESGIVAGDARTFDDNARLLHEARAAAALSHPNAVAIYDVGDVNGTAFIAMELLNGITLRAVLRQGTATFHQRVAWLIEIAGTLSAAHAAGLVHRDVKPENVMVCAGGVTKVLDFGIAKRVPIDSQRGPHSQGPSPASSTAAGQIRGTPRYMAPEQLLGERVDASADQFAWGLVAFELLTGIHPFEPTAPGDYLPGYATLLGNPLSLAQVSPQVPPALAAIVMRAIGKEQSARFRSMDEVLRALHDAGTGAAASAPQTLAAMGYPSPTVPTGAPSPYSGAPPSFAVAPPPMAGPMQYSVPAPTPHGGPSPTLASPARDSRSSGASPGDVAQSTLTSPVHVAPTPSAQGSKAPWIVGLILGAVVVALAGALGAMLFLRRDQTPASVVPDDAAPAVLVATASPTATTSASPAKASASAPKPVTPGPKGAHPVPSTLPSGQVTPPPAVAPDAGAPDAASRALVVTTCGVTAPPELLLPVVERQVVKLVTNAECFSRHGARGAAVSYTLHLKRGMVDSVTPARRASNAELDTCMIQALRGVLTANSNGTITACVVAN